MNSRRSYGAQANQNPHVKPLKPKRRQLARDRNKAVSDEVQKLVDARLTRVC